MFARIGTWQGSPEELENWVARAGEEVKPTSSVSQAWGPPTGWWTAWAERA
jgi:hypothetical protein